MSSSSTDQPDLSKPNTLKDYHDMLVLRRKEAGMNPLHRGCILSVKLDPYTGPATPENRPLPPFARNGGVFDLILVDAPHPFVHDEQYSQVWVADVHSLGFSFIPLPDLVWYLEVYDYVKPWTLWSTEDNAYRELESLQGQTVPYYFGKHKLTMPSGEDAEVLIMEYVEGKTIEDRPAHDTPDDLGDANEAYVEDMKQMFKKTLLGVHAINKLGVGHNDMHPGNIIVTPFGDSMVFDFAMAGRKFDPDDVRERYGNPVMTTGPLRHCCTQHDEEIFNWIGDELAKPSSWARY
ncbi:hypothetical protein EV421DRAFT_1911413 [Armillaria borealis]|uniref:ABC1 atypical kinase-like domain-containing protein n=1 Tax=Armillaria borealis TaxID=47425 RepID=A0AA39MFS5_9AGAR|nr:hypothetical protein EV421DRAFT_1911413 [Armillaria borealis]